MSKTLSLKKPLENDGAVPAEPVMPVEVKAYTADELRAMLAAMGEPVAPTRVITDATMDLSIDGLAPHVIADKSGLADDIYDRASSTVQLPPKAHGKFGLNGIPLIAPGVDLNESINPATGQLYAQIGTRPVTQIQPPPQNFSRRRG